MGIQAQIDGPAERTQTAIASSGLSFAVEEALQLPEIPDEIMRLVHQAAMPAAEALAARFGRCTRREECQRIVEMFSATGAEGVLHLRDLLRTGSPAVAASTVGLLSRFGSSQLERLLQSRLQAWAAPQHDHVVRQLALGAAPERGRLLMHIFSTLHSVALPEAIDELSLCGDPSTSGLLLRLAAGEMPQSADFFLRVKAVEGLGRMREPRAVPLLREIVSARDMGRWLHSEEMRIVALQTLGKIDFEWARNFQPQSGLRGRDLAMGPLDAAEATPWARHRRYDRVMLPGKFSVTAVTSQGEVPLETRLLSLGGGIANAEARLEPGAQGQVRISGWKNMTASVIFRDAPRKQIGFEIVKISMEDRARLRRMLSGFTSA